MVALTALIKTAIQTLQFLLHCTTAKPSDDTILVKFDRLK